MKKILKQKIKTMSPMKLIFLGYCVIILVGACLLMLPAVTREREATSFLDAFFTAASAVCVTGLVRFDTYQYWNLWGQIILLLMIQIGGIGFMTVAISLFHVTKKKISLSSRVLMKESVAAPQVGGIVQMTRFILKGTVLIEGTGAFLLSLYFCPRLGMWEGIYFSIFHSISAFCNAGFDLMGKFSEFSSLTLIGDQIYIELVLMSLIVIGGLGFFVWFDLLECKFSFKKMRLHTKLVLVVTGSLLLIGAVGIFLLEQNGNLFETMTRKEQLTVSAFQSVTVRTAGFNTVDISQLTESTQFLMICLMMIGGSTGSTAGGMKTTTIAVLFIGILAMFRRRKSMESFGRRIEDGVIRNAACILSSYLLLSVAAAMMIASIEQVSILSALFESVSAIGTVGLSLGMTPALSAISALVIAVLMVIGRVGSITILLAFSPDKMTASSKFPAEKIRVG